jgi:hypothetical protein
MSKPLVRETVPKKVRGNSAGIRAEERKPNLPGYWVYVGDFVDPGDPGNDPPFTNAESPPWENNFYYLSPVAFRHGVDGQTDMIGVYDLTLGAVSGDTAFHMPIRWALEMPLAVNFPIEISTGIWSIATQVCDNTIIETGGVPVKIYWPIVADPI